MKPPHHKRSRAAPHCTTLAALLTRRQFLGHITLATAATTLPGSTGCAPPPRLVVAVHPWVGYETLYLARDLKWLPNTIQLRDDQTLNESLAALHSGQADAACMTLDEMLRARSRKLPLAAALVFDVSAGADMVLARPGIERLADLANKRIGFDPDALGALVFEKLLEAAGLPASAVTAVNVPPARQLEAWHRNEVDAVITYEPLASAFLREGARNLFDSRQMPDTIIDVLVMRRDRPRIIPLGRILAAAHFRALEHLRTNEQDALYRISAREGLSLEETRRVLAAITQPSLAANRVYLVGSEARLLGAAKILSTSMVRRGLLARADDLDQLILPGALPSDDR
jgi:NitT/TauT family transport system substrate-binding protein